MPPELKKRLDALRTRVREAYDAQLLAKLRAVLDACRAWRGGGSQAAHALRTSLRHVSPLAARAARGGSGVEAARHCPLPGARGGDSPAGLGGVRRRAGEGPGTGGAARAGGAAAQGGD